jgi:FixJ family two-component response regulator
MRPSLPLVVVIEDDRATLKALGRVLRAGGFETAAYSSAEEFLATPPTQHPLCLVVDVQLGRMSGLELQRRLRASAPTLPVIVMTAFEDPRVRAEAQRLGCAGFLDKSADIEDLLNLLRTVRSELPN